MRSVIRRFRISYEEFRHVFDLFTDEVFLQRMNEASQWEDLLRYDPWGNVWDVKTDKLVGSFRNNSGNWLFYENENDPRKASYVVCQPSAGAESLLDSEVTISTRWINNGGAV